MAYDGRAPNVTIAEAAGLVYVHDDDPGFSRVRRGRGFRYLDCSGAPIGDLAVIDRIRRLGLPPAYSDVWICVDAQGHIQATGRDERGRKQYRYHERWVEARSSAKFGRLAAFGRAMPELRAALDRDLRRSGLPRDKVVATVVRLLEATLIRVGNAEYVLKNKSFGLTTMHSRHLRLDGAELRFEFRGKSGVLHKVRVQDRRLARIVRSIQELPGQRLFQYLDAEGERRLVESGDVNAYIRAATGDDFSAKDFRTWGATLAVAKALALHPAPTDAREIKRTVVTCVKGAAALLGNTPAVCRSAYIHPDILLAFAEGRLPEPFAKLEGAEFEREVVGFLDRR